MIRTSERLPAPRGYRFRVANERWLWDICAVRPLLPMRSCKSASRTRPCVRYRLSLGINHRDTEAQRKICGKNRKEVFLLSPPDSVEHRESICADGHWQNFRVSVPLWLRT